MTIRELQRDEVRQVWSIDRSEVIDNFYHHESGQLVLRPEHRDVRGWPAGQPESYGRWLLDCYDSGGSFFGAFEDGSLVGVVVVENRFMGPAKDQLQLKFLHVSRAHRKTGLGRRLFERAVSRARELGARRLYISSIPSQNTVEFYLHLGCRVTDQVDQALFEAEPNDIHMEFDIPETGAAGQSGGTTG